MAVSGTNTFNLTRDAIIKRAFSILGIRTQGRNLTSWEMNEASDVLNMLVKSWKSKGTYLWKTIEGTLFLVNGQAKYTLDGSTANATESFTQTTTSAAASSGASDIVVTSATGFTVGYNIGVVQDDNTIHWTTISAIASTTITLTATLTDDVSSGAKVFVYETGITRPEEVTQARFRASDDETDTLMTTLARDTYFQYSDKFSTGTPNSYYYDRQLTYGDIYVYPTPDDVDTTIKFTFEKQFFDFTSAVDDPDFPPEWLLPIATNLAYLLSFDYGIGMEKAERIKRDAEQFLADAEGYDKEATSVYFQPETVVYQNY